MSTVYDLRSRIVALRSAMEENRKLRRAILMLDVDPSGEVLFTIQALDNRHAQHAQTIKDTEQVITEMERQEVEKRKQTGLSINGVPVGVRFHALNEPCEHRVRGYSHCLGHPTDWI